MTTSPTAGRDDRVALRFLAAPSDTAAGGRSVAAGSVMEWIDKAGYACAVGWSGAYCVTAYIGNVQHRRPIPPGSLVEVQARLVHTGRSSMHIIATVSASEVGSHELIPATTCILVFVAKGPDGHSAPVPAWEPVSRSDRKLAAAALERIPPRAAIKTIMLDEDDTGRSRTSHTTLRFLIPPSVVNFGGKAHGGTVVRWIDEAASTAACAWSGDAAAVGVYSGGIHFLAPAHIGDLAEVDARVVCTTERSMHVSIRVSTADPRTPSAMTVTARCMSVYVVPGADGTAQPVPQWTPRTGADKRLAEHARDIIDLRGHIVPIPVSLGLAR